MKGFMTFENVICIISHIICLLYQPLWSILDTANSHCITLCDENLDFFCENLWFICIEFSNDEKTILTNITLLNCSYRLDKLTQYPCNSENSILKSSTLEMWKIAVSGVFYAKMHIF